ncbi:PREDICTED: atrial natriuretic peptide receptor 1-like [Priapulus caudatus]|uniref:Guanylate cyclase n=1 Tax=Priapulus caudatus TaxID=37621 RepID=A0ABM1DSG3_PRICU|nr:PREDICTED: atrial natriuretic peptide receptor 1-like [Priapulus caudatus]
MIISFVVHRKYKLEQELADMSWKVVWADIDFSKHRTHSMASVSKLSIMSAATDVQSMGSLPANAEGQMFTKVGHLKGHMVAMKHVALKKLDLTREVLLELKRMRDMNHDNVARFVGACVDPSNVAILTEYCSKGSLQDILSNESIKLDWLFRFSLVNDIINGMIYIHSTAIGSHGRLKSTNCVVDGRFVLKITDAGLPSFRESSTLLLDIDSYSYFRAQQWTAPELLRLDRAPPGGTKKGDVYSFAIILQEIATRADPHETSNLSPREIIENIKKPMEPPFRPQIDASSCTEQYAALMKRCWGEEPDQRPDFTMIQATMKIVNKGQKAKGNIVDNLLHRMEQYANNLEDLVEERTTAFVEEKKRSEELLYRVLPKSVADQLKLGRSVDPEAYDLVTIYFSDIVGFTAISAASTPIQVVNLLNDLYTLFDAIIAEYDVYKVETIGDAYMVVSGLPLRNGNNHTSEICRMALHLLRTVTAFRMRHRPTDQLKLRIGIHSGPCVAGVVGLTMPRYCLFGDTVNTASRMESNGLPLKIHVSVWSRRLLEPFDTFILEERGEIEMKGKGAVLTYWLLGEK